MDLNLCVTLGPVYVSGLSCTMYRYVNHYIQLDTSTHCQKCCFTLVEKYASIKQSNIRENYILSFYRTHKFVENKYTIMLEITGVSLILGEGKVFF